MTSSLVPRGQLAAALLRASDWFDAALRSRLAAAGWPHLTRTRSLLFFHLSRGVDRPVALARELDISRQATHKLLDGLVADGLLARSPDPDDGRAHVVALTPRGRTFVREAGAILARLEQELAGRIGDESVDALRRALAVDLGPPPTTSTRRPP